MKKKCAFCNSENIQNYCPNCGRPAQVKRIDGGYMMNEIASIFSFDKGIFHTIKELTIRPGKSINDFLFRDRKRLVKPLVFIIITSLFYTLVVRFFQIEDAYVDSSFDYTSHVALLFQWIQTHYGYANFLMGIFIALWIFLFFREYNYNIFEILILLCFVIGMAMLIFGFFGLIEGLIDFPIMQLAGIIGFVYVAWSIGQFFEGKIINYIKAVISYILGMLTFIFIVILIGMVLDKMM